jgi:hypothetical protein
MTHELFEAIKSKLARLSRGEKQQMIIGLRYGFNLALSASKYSKGPLSDDRFVGEFFDWLDEETRNSRP